MKKIFALIASMIVTAVFAQQASKSEQVKSLKVAFITNELQLSPSESAKFWPVYNEYETKQRELRKRVAKDYLKRRSPDDNLSDKEATVILSQIETNEEEMLALRKKLNNELKAIISPVKILKLRKAEEDFNRKLLKQYRQKKSR